MEYGCDAMIELTPRQQEVLDFIIKFKEERGYSPSFREIANGLNIKSTRGAADHIAVLEKKGYITRDAGVMRSIRVIA